MTFVLCDTWQNIPLRIRLFVSGRRFSSSHVFGRLLPFCDALGTPHHPTSSCCVNTAWNSSSRLICGLYYYPKETLKMADDEEIDLPDPSLKNIIEQKTLQWVFVGGKGGVGKTTTSCCLGVQLAKSRKKVG